MQTCSVADTRCTTATAAAVGTPATCTSRNVPAGTLWGSPAFPAASASALALREDGHALDVTSNSTRNLPRPQVPLPWCLTRPAGICGGPLMLQRPQMDPSCTTADFALMHLSPRSNLALLTKPDAAQQMGSGCDLHLLWARVGAWKAKTRAYSRGRFSLGSQGLERQLRRPRNLAKRVRAAMSAGVSICRAMCDEALQC